LPIWVCEQTGEMESIGSYYELLAKPGVLGTHVWEEAKRANPALVDDLKVHKPYIDAVTYDSPFSPGARMKRVTEVIDCWYDSGAMPFAQWGYPHQNQDKFKSQFPADFISEALDQTRGWFYSLLAISTLLFSEDGKGNPNSEIRNSKSMEYPYPHPYRTCIVLGLMLSEWYEGPKNRPSGAKAQIFLSEDEAKKACGPGNYEQLVGKMSKSKRNYSEPQQIFDKYGADALRWYFFANQAPWTSIRYSETAIKESIPKFLLTLWNCYSFFVIYANSDDKFDPGERLAGDAGQLTAKELSRAKGYRSASQRRELDRWILSELNLACAQVVEKMDAYDNFGACKVLDALVDNLSNWYVRRSRSRFWSTEYDSPDKLDAYWTLYECLITTCKLIAPFTPFVAEAMWRNLAGVFGERAVESVHLCDFPTGDAQLADAELSEQMELSRLVVSLGLRARMSAKIKVRQPLAKVEVILANQKHQAWLAEHRDVVAEELNVKEVEFTDEPDKYINHSVQPNWKALGPKLGKLLPQVKKWLGEQSAADLLANLRDNGKIDLTVSDQAIALLPEELNVQISAKPGWTAANDKGVVVVLSTELTPQLVGEGLARDLVRAVNDLRKETGCQFTDRIELAIVTESNELQSALRDNAAYIQSETQADSLGDKSIPGVEGVGREIGDFTATIFLRVK
jgi:isoleucyl-tRNA synthetase